MAGEGLRIGEWCHVVDCDLKAFFDTVDHQKLMSRLRKRITDVKLLALILKYLKAGAISQEGRYEESLKGGPQGGPLSPLLANIDSTSSSGGLTLRVARWAIYVRSRQSLPFCSTSWTTSSKSGGISSSGTRTTLIRAPPPEPSPSGQPTGCPTRGYRRPSAVILCRSPRAGQRILRNIRRYLAERLKLVVNETKSRVVPLAEASFLGFHIVRRKVRWTAKSQKKFKDKVRQITKRTRGHSPKKVIAELKTYVRGAFNYYGLGILYREALELDGWLRTRVRLYYWKQWGRPRTRRRNLLKLGIGRTEVHRASRARKGHWRMSHNSLVKRAMNNAWLEEQGVPSLEKQWVSTRYPEGAKKASV